MNHVVSVAIGGIIGLIITLVGPLATKDVPLEPQKPAEQLYAYEWPIEARQPEPPVVGHGGASESPCSKAIRIAHAAGWPLEQLATAQMVIRRESGPNCDPNAHNPRDPHGGSYGLFQLNGYFCEKTSVWPDGYFQTALGHKSCADLYDPKVNAAAAYFLWLQYGWAPWGL